MDPRRTRLVFISYDFENDRQLARSIRSFFEAEGGPCAGEPTFVSGLPSGTPDETIDEHIRATMERCECAVFVVGDNVHNSPWIEREARIASSKGLGLVAIRLEKAKGAPPKKLVEAKAPIVEWIPSDLASALNPLSRKRDGRAISA